MTTFTHRSIAAAAALFATVATVAAAAPAQAQTMTREVAFADLDLTTDAGQAALDRRLRHAVDMVCGRADPREAGYASIAKCRRDAAFAARTDVQRLAANARATGTMLAAK